MRAPKFPEKIRRGSSVVTIYHTPTKGHEAYTVAHYDFSGRINRRMLSNYAEARRLATALAEQMAAGLQDTCALTGAELFVYRRAVEKLGSLPVPLDIAIIEYVEAVRALNGATVTEAVSFYLANRPAGVIKTCQEVLNEMIDVKTKKGRSELTIKDLRYRLSLFAAAFPCPIHNVTAAQIDAYLHALACSGRTKNNHRRLIGMLFHFAKMRGYVPPHHLGVSAVERVSEQKSEIGVFTPPQMARMLVEANSQLRLAMAIMAFTGIRHSEVQRLDWRDVKLEEGHILLGAANTKTRARRLTPIPVNLQLWLKPHAKLSGPVAPYTNLCEPMVRVARRASVPWVRNGLRHSAISYLVALKDNAELVALECGTSAAMMFRHYRKVVTKQQAEAWFQIVP